MKMYTYMLLAYCCLIGCKNQTTSHNMPPNSIIETKVDSLLSLMTLEEKVGQLNQYAVGSNLTGPAQREGLEKLRYEQLLSGQVGSVLNLVGAHQAYEMQKQVVENSRLGIPLIFAYDVIHGYKTMFPIPLAESASWDLDAIEQSAKIAAKEAASAGIQWTFAPMIDISRDARWGRVMEGAGEDPFLGSEIARARVKGFQGNDLSAITTIAACAKHFAAYGFVESGKEYNNVYIGQHTLMNTVIPPFKAALEADVATFMNAFNDIDGIPATAHKQLLRTLLKGEWQYDGLVVSDWNSIGELMNHGVAKDKKQAAKLAIQAGTDVDMEGIAYIDFLKELVENGTVAESVINDAVKRILRLKFKLGLFDDPYQYFDVNREKATLLHQDHLDASREVAKKSIVLLKNENNLLPLTTKSIAVIGPLAKDKDSPLGNWRAAANANSAVSFYEGLAAAIGKDVTLSYAEGCKLSLGPNVFYQQMKVNQDDRSGFAQAIAQAQKAETVIMVLGETAYMSGEGRSRSELGLPGVQLDLLKAVYQVNKNIILVLMNGRPLAITWEAEHIPAILETWHLGAQAGHAIADVLTGKYNPSGKLPMSFPRNAGQAPIYYNHKITGRPAPNNPGEVFYSHFTDVDNSPLYPFGYGLSYSTFDYSE
ncbi:MAG: glycoside hydrolase family 3 N-terminal domain-containing protein, partial [Flammeovirgaceae bacterium]